MLQRLHLVFLLMISSLPGWAQSQQCRDLVFTTQQQVDDFAAIGCSGITGNLTIYGDDIIGPGGITNLAPLSTITFVTGNLSLVLSKLPNIQGLDNIKSVGGKVTITSSTVLNNLDQNAFSSLETVGTMSIADNTSLTNISGFPKLRSINAIEITRNSRLGAITGLNALSTVGSLVISQCGSLRSISGFNSLATVSTSNPMVGSQLIISRNKSLGQIAGFTVLSVADALIITNNLSLTELSGFNALKSVQQLQIQSDSSLTSIAGFNGKLVATGSVSIAYNPVLRSITGFSDLSAVSLGISSNKALLDVKGFSSGKLTGVNISFNENLKSISGFTLADVTGSVSINYNDRLDSIITFKGATAPTYIGIENNASLRSITGAFAYSSNSTLNMLRLVNNPVLAACTQPWICQYLRRGGNATISGNAASCTQAAILAECLTLATKEPVAVAPAYPNPVRDVLHLSASGPFRVCDLLGRVLLQGQGASLSMAALPQGIYVVQTGPDLKHSFRVVKQ